MIHEESLILDRDSGLFGILSLPDRALPKSPALILPPAGLIHRVGPFRLHVHMARGLAAAGFAVLRLDKPGAGDVPRLEHLTEPQALRLAMDRVSHRTGVDSFAIGGLCSAADVAWRATLADRRVKGMLLLDGLAYKGLWYHVGRLQNKLSQSPRNWIPARMRPLRTTGPEPVAPAASQLGELDFRDWPPMNEAIEQLQQMLERGVEVQAIYTGGNSYFLHRKQIGATFGSAARHPHFHAEYWPGCDHTFMLRPDRNRLIETVRAWLQRIHER